MSLRQGFGQDCSGLGSGILSSPANNPLNPNLRMESVSRRFILGQRVGHSMLCCVIFQLVTLLVISFPLTMNAWQPGLWVRNIVDVSQCVVGYTIPLSMILCVVCLINNEDTESGKKLLPSRFSFLCNIFTLRNMVMSSAFTLIGGVVFYLYASLIGGEYGKLITDCAGYRCLLENHFYLILCGSWMGQTYFLRNYILDNQPVIHFVVQQSKIRLLKSELKPLIKRAFVEAIWPTIFFAVTYYLKGDSVRDMFCEIFYIKFEDDPLSTRLVNATLFIFSWLLASIFFASLNTVKLILQIFMTDHKTFPIMKLPGDINSITLHQALGMKKIPAIQNLGYQDLMILAATDVKRRGELFSLSLPGGHPHNWNAIIQECIMFVNSFSAELTLAISNHTIIAPTIAPKPAVVNSPTPFSPTLFSPNHSQVRLRNLSVRPGEVTLPVLVPLPIGLSVAQRIQKKLNLLKENICNRALFIYAFGELPDSKVNFVCSKGQSVIWAIQSLSLLAAASYHEDQYGVAQKDLPIIIGALLQLKQVMDKFQKISSYKKCPRNEHHHIKLRHALRSAVKLSLYRITVTFGNHLHELPISEDVLLQVNNFILNREC